MASGRVRKEELPEFADPVFDDIVICVHPCLRYQYVREACFLRGLLTRIALVAVIVCDYDSGREIPCNMLEIPAVSCHDTRTSGCVGD